MAQAAVNSYLVGTTAVATLEVRDLAGVLTNAPTLVATVNPPVGADSTPTVNTTGTGLYNVQVPLTVPGDWWVNWAASGGAILPIVVEHQIRAESLH